MSKTEPEESIPAAIQIIRTISTRLEGFANSLDERGYKFINSCTNDLRQQANLIEDMINIASTALQLLREIKPDKEAPTDDALDKLARELVEDDATFAQRLKDTKADVEAAEPEFKSTAVEQNLKAASVKIENYIQTNESKRHLLDAADRLARKGNYPGIQMCQHCDSGLGIVNGRCDICGQPMPTS